MWTFQGKDDVITASHRTKNVYFSKGTLLVVDLVTSQITKLMTSSQIPQWTSRRSCTCNEVSYVGHNNQKPKNMLVKVAPPDATISSSHNINRTSEIRYRKWTIELLLPVKAFYHCLSCFVFSMQYIFHLLSLKSSSYLSKTRSLDDWEKLRSPGRFTTCFEKPR